MKTWKQGIIDFLVIFAILLVFIACDDKNNTPVLCTCPAGTTHEPNEKCCNGTDCNCPIAEPEEKEFSISFDFQNVDNPGVLYNVPIKDERTACGSKTLEQLNIITIIQQVIQGAYNTVATSNSQRNRFRTVFGQTDGVTIIVNNQATFYKINVPDKSTMYFHIDYLKSNPSDIQQIIFYAVTAMRNPDFDYPYYVDDVIYPVE